LNPIEKLLNQTIDIGEIPALPEAARMAMFKTLTIEKSAEEISSIIKEDPSLTLKILKIANSSFYSRSGSVSNIKDAIILLGYKTVKAIILSVSVKDMFSGKETSWFNYKNFWLHSLATAFVTEEITKILKLPSGDVAYATGLLHDIGKIILLLSSEEKYRQVIELIEKEKLYFYTAETKIFGFDHTDVSEFLFDYWELPKVLTEPIHQHHLSSAAPIESANSTLLTLKLANEITHIARFSISEHEPPYEVSEAIVERIGLLNEELDEILHNLEKYITTIGEILNIPKTDIKGYFEILSSSNKELGKMYIENQRMVQEVNVKTSILAELNRLSLLFLKERELESALPVSLRSFLISFHFDAVSIEFYLNGEKSMLFKAFYPTLFSEDGKAVRSSEIEEVKSVIKRGSVTPFEKGPDIQISEYILKSGDGVELGKLSIKSSDPSEPSDVQTFFDQFTLGLNNLRLHLMNKLKSEKLNIAVKQLKEENDRRQSLIRLNRLVLDNSPIGILSINEKGNIESYNREAERLFLEELKNKNIFKLTIIQKNDLQDTLEGIVYEKKSGNLRAERDGRGRSFHIECTPIEETGSTLILVDDITERLENEIMIIQKEKMATLGELAAGIAHNLRSPLAVVKGIPEMIISELEQKKLQGVYKAKALGGLENDIKENMELITKSMDKAFAIIDSIMDFSKKETGEFENLNLEQIVNEAFLLVEHRLKRKTIHIINNTKGSTIYGNKHMLIQVFVNLITNSIDAIEKSGTIEVHYKKENGKSVIHFIDDGKGIKKSDRERIFEPFYTTSGKANGTGIGLSITRKMVTLLGGSIRARTGREKGAVMEITFTDKGSYDDKNIDH
jgi:PAS domain S-box-containing protein